MRRGTPPLLLALLVFFSIPFGTRAQVSNRYLGSVTIVAFNFAPLGWATCDGQLMSIAQNTALFSLLGTTYGGNGVTTFALPDLRGRIPIGQGQAPGLQNYNLGQSGGEEAVTLAVSQIPSHSHTAMGSTSTANTGSVTGAYWAQPRVLLYSALAPTVPMSSSAIGSAGGGQAHENLKPYLVVNYIIALEGIYPSQN